MAESTVEPVVDRFQATLHLRFHSRKQSPEPLGWYRPALVAEAELNLVSLKEVPPMRALAPKMVAQKSVARLTATVDLSFRLVALAPVRALLLDLPVEKGFAEIGCPLPFEIVCLIPGFVLVVLHHQGHLHLERLPVRRRRHLARPRMLLSMRHPVLWRQSAPD